MRGAWRTAGGHGVSSLRDTSRPEPETEFHAGKFKSTPNIMFRTIFQTKVEGSSNFETDKCNSFTY
jgi:hypothetical protein